MFLKVICDYKSTCKNKDNEFICKTCKRNKSASLKDRYDTNIGKISDWRIRR